MALVSGFWKQIEHPSENSSQDWNFCMKKNVIDFYKDDENESGKVKLERCISLYDFFHDRSDIFAKMLHDKFGYALKNVYEIQEDGSKKLLHSYCEIPYEGAKDGKLYVDARGACDDYGMFIQTFMEDGLWASEDDIYIESGVLAARKEKWEVTSMFYSFAMTCAAQNQMYSPFSIQNDLTEINLEESLEEEEDHELH